MKESKKKTKWCKKRHDIVFALLRPVFRLYLKLRYNYSAKKCDADLSKGALIYCNHTTVLDPFMVACSFKRPIFYMMNDDLFTLGFLSKVISFLVNPIPKSKSKSDINAVKYTLQVIKERGVVGIFPEGNRTLSGVNWEMDDSSARLAKKAKVPLVLYNIVGGYGSDPRWGGSVRKGKMTGEAVKVISPEELEKMSVEEIDEQIKLALETKDLKSGIAFKSRKRAEFIERATYYCPNCGEFNSIYTKGSKILCKTCSLEGEYTENLKILPIKGNLLYKDTSEWFLAQREELKARVKALSSEQTIFFDEAEIFLILGTKRKKTRQSKG